MGVIQSSINQALGAAEHGLTALAIKNVASGVKDIKGSVENLKGQSIPAPAPLANVMNELKEKQDFIDKQQNNIKNKEYITNPVMRQLFLDEENSQNAVSMKKSLKNRYDTLTKQKKNTRTLEGQLMIDTSIGKLPQSIIDKAEVRDGE